MVFLLIAQSGSIRISKLAPKAFNIWKHVQTSAYSSIAAGIVLQLRRQAKYADKKT